ncbi:integral membrane protein [Sodiomyces alkalinus F11]|uniref:Integral membrane protein n=1 Tax=Sodiomyces alkalinus (strain CBS 110278 / VKM F-3762 / F11) TaxID=1314773 RepID=A0A3N2PR94_SODAK|nr:integral membrane protein [Sodiomyces alkalinus F11]ROT36990.1 integral membrane protein [Sodiomyces alkalinus F11]
MTSNRPHLFSRLSSPAFAAWLILVIACFYYQPAAAVRIPFDNCLPDSYRLNEPLPLQWEPLYADAHFDTETGNHNLQVIFWGNVSGSHFDVTLPPPGDPHWNDPEEHDGKIVRIPQVQDPSVTTLVTNVNVLTYRDYRDHADFCRNKLVNASCPVAPVFDPNVPFHELPSFNMSHDFLSSYAFTSFSVTFLVIFGDSRATNIGCASSTVTPDLGDLAGLVRWLPLVILGLVGFATVFAGIYSPWGTTDIFRWTSNFGRDEDLLRLVTPGFGDCLQYIQFVALTGALTLHYPGFYQPIVSQVGWSALMFNESIVSHTPGWQAVQDGIYVTDGIYGLQRYAQLVGMADVGDIWAGMMVWLLVIIGAVLVLTQLGFLLRWLYRQISSTAEEDLRAKNMPFSVGNIVRIVFNYLLLPIVALSTFQFVVAGDSPAFAVGLAAVTLAIFIGFAGWLLYLIIRTRPRAVIFDDLPTVLLYGPLYNTYSDEAAAFALVPLLLTFVRGIAIGAVQPVGIAQIVLLAICEIIHVLALHAIRPFHSPTSMNAYHTLFCAVRFITVMLMVAFIPDLGVTEGTKGWVGYTILVIHAGVLVLGFFLNALQRIVEVAARLLGAGGEDGLARGGLARIFGMRQLQRRMSRRNGPSRQSQLSSTAMLGADDASKSGYAMPGGRVRSESAGSGFLLKHHQRNSSALDSIDAGSAMPRGLDSGSMFTPTTPAQASTFSFLPSPGGATRPQPAVITMETADPYYRPPRRRGDTLTGSLMSDRRPVSTSDSRRYSQPGPVRADSPDAEGPQIERGSTPAPIPIHLVPRADYSTREVDFYYGVRGPALNSEGPGRKLGTGPADPTGPMASAAGWFRNMFIGKSKEKGKGFEVVRSARMPPAMRTAGGGFGHETPPEGIHVAMGVLRNGPIDSDDEEPRRKASEPQAEDLLTGDGNQRGLGSRNDEASKASRLPPTLPTLDCGEGFKLRSENSSGGDGDAARAEGQARNRLGLDPPDIPRKSSKRHSGADFDTPETAATMSGQIHRLPFDRSHSQKRLSSKSSMEILDDFSQVDLGGRLSEERPTSFGYVPHHSISRVDPGQNGQIDLLGAMAEVVDERGLSTRTSRETRTS